LEKDIDRTKFIGSSEIAAVCGLSRWATPLSVWAEKTGLVDPDDLSEVECIEWGIRLEEPVAQKFADKHDVKIMAYKKRFTHPEHDFLSCELDRIITGTDTIIEVKTCNAWKAKEWDGEEYPLEYCYQVQFAMGLSGRKKAWMVCLIGGQKYVEKELDFDQEMFDTMVEKAVEFWGMVQERVPPVAVSGDRDILSELYPGDDELDEVVLTEEEEHGLLTLLDMLRIGKESIKSAKKETEKLENQIKQRMEDSEVMNVRDYRVTWKSQVSRRLDTKKVKEDGLFDKYSKESVSRVLRIGNPKKKEKKDE